MQKPKHHIFICTSSRPTGQQKGFCHTKEGVDVMAKFMEEIDDRELGGDVEERCYGICNRGEVVVYPDNVWYGSVGPDDVCDIMDQHIEGGTVVERLVI